MSISVECVGCEQGRHEEHRAIVQAAPEGGVGGATCSCRGECVNHGDLVAAMVEDMFGGPFTESNDERHWRVAGIAAADRLAWAAVDAALRPFLNCEPKDHHPSCCPAVIAVIAAARAAIRHPPTTEHEETL